MNDKEINVLVFDLDAHPIQVRPMELLGIDGVVGVSFTRSEEDVTATARYGPYLHKGKTIVEVLVQRSIDPHDLKRVLKEMGF